MCIDSLRVAASAACLACLATSCSENQENPTFAGAYTIAVQPGYWDELGMQVFEHIPGFLLHVEGKADAYRVTLTTTTIEESGTLLVAGPQQLCNPTAQVSAAGAYPKFELGPAAVPIYLHHSTLDIAVLATAHDFALTDVLPADGSPVEGTLSAVLDVREVYPLFASVAPNNADRVCESVAGAEVGTACGACPPLAPPGDYCITIAAQFVSAEPAPTRTIQPVTTPDASCFFE